MNGSPQRPSVSPEIAELVPRDWCEENSSTELKEREEANSSTSTWKTHGSRDFYEGGTKAKYSNPSLEAWAKGGGQDSGESVVQLVDMKQALLQQGSDGLAVTHSAASNSYNGRAYGDGEVGESKFENEDTTASMTKSLLDSSEGGTSEGRGGEGSTRPGKHYIVILTLAAGIGGFLFGYDTGVISGALLYIRDDFPSVDRSTELQEAIVSMAILGAAVGASIGGQINDRYGRKFSILAADGVFAMGAILMAMAMGPSVLIIGRILVGLGVGVASMTVPLYIAEASPASVRGALVSVNVLMITSGQFLSYLINVAFTEVPGTWRWMLGIAAVPAVIQAILMVPLPESPRWLFKQGRSEEAVKVMRLLRTEAELKVEVGEMVEMEEAEWRKATAGKAPRLWDLVATKQMRRALTAGVGLQILQQLVGINTVMYYSPSIVELAGIAAHKTALLLSLLVAGMNAVGTIAGIVFIDRCGRRILVMCSLVGVIVALGLLGLSFNLTAQDSPPVEPGGLPSALQFECPAVSAILAGGSLDCMGCLQAGCGFCTAPGDQMMPGACLVRNGTTSDLCWESGGAWFSRGCPSNYGWLALVGLALYIAAFAPGMGPVPWAVNSEIYPLKLRGLAGGVAATANWVANLLVAQTFLTMVRIFGTATTFLLFGGVAIFALIFVWAVLPETKGLSLQQVEQLWEDRASGREESSEDVGGSRAGLASRSSVENYHERGHHA